MKEKYYLNFNDLNEEVQERIVQDAIIDLEDEQDKEELQEEAALMNMDYDEFITEKAERYMINFDFEFNV
ncbi:hypothetical protein CIL05_07075 [Virgibacillus profundi]|uniref:Uncharacterized protein n=1 Tax=Virgibacillus profundi TaxID=2024555 RepID=A0A2A2IF88_9BACI|nr:hypothetical protein [Virgibacillus profundi]PAV30222.1 hypothetical protein CIL05_07075 [Virgibacillus profundi]PXY54394.1 hypothetical protein CIT14_07160 [Virgibacillus profundi]